LWSFHHSRVGTLSLNAWQRSNADLKIKPRALLFYIFSYPAKKFYISLIFNTFKIGFRRIIIIYKFCNVKFKLLCSFCFQQLKIKSFSLGFCLFKKIGQCLNKFIMSFAEWKSSFKAFKCKVFNCTGGLFESIFDPKKGSSQLQCSLCF
jgi:hypothetical protein